MPTNPAGSKSLAPTLRNVAVTLVAVGALVALTAPSAHAARGERAAGNDLHLTQRQTSVSGNLDVGSATKVAEKLLAYDAQSPGPIFLMITATKGTAQGVMVVADTIRSLQSPVVGVVMTEVHGAGAAVAVFCDRVVVFPSAGFVFTELDYEGVAKPKKKDTEPVVEKIEMSVEPQADGDAADSDTAETPAAAADAKQKPAEEPDPAKLLLERARETYLERIHARLAKRLYFKPGTLEAKLDEGGFLVTATEAVDQKIAYSVVDRMTLTKLPETKRELKVTTTETEAETVESTTTKAR